MREVVIVEAVRAPIGKRNGMLSALLPVQLAARVLRALIERAQIDPALIEDVIFGCVTPLGEQGANITRLAVLQVGLPVEIPAVTLNRMCGSGQQAVHFAAQAIAAGDMEVVIAGGLEVMNRVRAWRAEGIPACYTVDAGPNVHVICPETEAHVIDKRLREIPGVQNVLVARAGAGAQIVKNGD